MPSLIHIYEGFNEALHAVQELEAAKIPTDAISLIILNGKTRLTVPKTDANGKESATEYRIDTNLRGKFFDDIAVQYLAGLEPVVARGWIVDEIFDKTPKDDLAPNGQGLETAQPIGFIAALVDNGLSKEFADTYLEGIKRGVTLLAVRVSEAQQAIATQVMCEDHCPVDPRMRGKHYVARKSTLRDPGKISSDRVSAMLIGGVKKN